MANSNGMNNTHALLFMMDCFNDGIIKSDHSVERPLAVQRITSTIQFMCRLYFFLSLMSQNWYPIYALSPYCRQGSVSLKQMLFSPAEYLTPKITLPRLSCAPNTSDRSLLLKALTPGSCGNKFCVCCTRNPYCGPNKIESSGTGL